MQPWVIVSASPLATLFVWASSEEEARRLALEHLAEKVPGVDVEGIVARGLQPSATPYVAFSNITTIG